MTPEGLLMYLAKTKSSSTNGQQLLIEVSREEGTTQKELSERLDIVHSSVSKLMAKHEKDGAVVEERDGNEVRYSPAPSFHIPDKDGGDGILIEATEIFKEKRELKANCYRILFALMADGAHTQKELVDMLEWNSGSVSVAMRQLLAANMVVSTINDKGQIAYRFNEKWRKE